MKTQEGQTMASEEAVEELQVDQPFDSTPQPEQSDAESLVGNCGAPKRGANMAALLSSFSFLVLFLYCKQKNRNVLA